MTPCTTLKLAPYNMTCNPLLLCPRVGAFSKVTSLHVVRRDKEYLPMRGTPVLKVKMVALLGRTGKVQPPRRGSMIVAAASTHPSWITDKPRWWWRTFACVPYLLPLHEAWMYADHVYKLHGFLEKFEFLADPFLDTYSLLPNWFMMVLMYAVYVGIVRRKELPHFLRYHVVMSLLMSLASQAVAIVCGWLPGALFKGWMLYLWLAAALVQMFAVLKCMQCSLFGAYPDVPFLSDAVKFNLNL